MRKKDKLYTVNKWNQSMFGSSSPNLFSGGGDLIWDRLASREYGQDYGEAGHTMDDYKNSTNFLGISKKDNPFSVGNLKNVLTSTGIKNGLIGAVGTAGSALLSNGLNSGAGSFLTAAGGALSPVNPLLGTAVSLVGGGVNALTGTSTDQAKLQAANAGTNYYKNFTSNATSFDGIQGPMTQEAIQNPYKSGLLNKGWARKRNAALAKQRAVAEDWANRGVDNNIDNIADTQANTLFTNWHALGGPLVSEALDGNTGAIDYGFMSDYLMAKDKAAGAKNKMSSNVFGSLPVTPFNTYAFGGDVQTNGSDFGTGLTHIDAGGSHEENPYEGVPAGVNPENGQPNVLEEGETVYDDYVFSDRIVVDDATKKKFHVGKKAELSYADLSKKLEKESAERPNDPISKRALKQQLHALADEQERQKAEMQERQLQEEFAALPPEQQQALMQQLAMQEQQEQQGQPMMEQQPMPEEAQMADPQMSQQQQMEQQQMMQPQEGAVQMGAYGGKVNRFDDGGPKHTGTWKDPNENHWDKYSKPGLQAFIDNAKARLAMAPDEATKDAVRKEIVDAFNKIQESYASIYPKTAADSYPYEKAVEDHQTLWDNAYGNTGFYSVDENGNPKENLIANAIDLPDGAATQDILGKWTDGFWGPRTSIRNMGSTEYGDADYYKDITKEFNDMGINFTPNKDLVYNGNQLYSLSIPQNKAAETADVLSTPWSKYAQTKAASPVAKKEEESMVVPILKKEWPRYAGLFGPVVGLGMQALGIGKPNYSGLDAALNITNEGSALADYKPIGNYLTYKPMDIWSEQNRLDANSRATDRYIRNTSSPTGTKVNQLIGNNYASQLAGGELYKKALELNYNQNLGIANFNRGTDMFNAEGYNKVSLANADIQNRNKQLRASLALDAARQKMAADAAWNQGIYGNVAGLFKGMGDLGRENAQYNAIAKMAADGLFGTIGEKQYIGNGLLKTIPMSEWEALQAAKSKSSSKGGKIRRKKGLTC